MSAIIRYVFRRTDIEIIICSELEYTLKEILIIMFNQFYYVIVKEYNKM